MQKFILISILMSSFAFAQTPFDKNEQLDGVLLKSGKENSLRTYVGTIDKMFSFPMALVQKAVTGFADRCNNDYKSKRKYVSEDFECKYHSENVVETFVVKDINKSQILEGYSEFYILGRQVYNRSSSGFYELVTVKNSTNDKNQAVTTVVVKMLDDEEVRNFITPKFNQDSSFEETIGVFTLTAISPTETHLSYDYKASTKHWLLNKEILVPQVFASMSKNMNQLLKTVEEESSVQKRELASNK